MSASRRAHGFNALGAILTPVSALAMAPLLARGLGPTDRGVFSNDQALLLIASALVALGVSDAAAVYWQRWTRRQRILVTGFNVTGSVVFGSAVVLYAIALRDPEHIELWILGIGALIMGQANQARGVALSRSAIGDVAVEKWIASLGRLALTVVLFTTGNLTIVTGLIALLVPQLIGAIFLTIRNRATPKSSDEDGPDVEPAHLGMLGWAIAGGAGGVLVVNLDSLILLPVIGPTELGYYAIAVTLADLYTTAAKPFRDAALTTGDGPTLNRIILRCFLLLVALSACAAATFWFIIPLLFGQAFSPAIACCYVMIAGGIAKGIGFLLNGVLVRVHRPGGRLAATLFGLAANIGAIFIFAGLGATGAAIAASIGYVVMAAVSWMLVHRELGGRPALLST